MTIDEVKAMLPQKPERMETVEEHYQTFGYLRATKFPIAILVNFGTDRRAQIERFHYNEGKLYVF